MMMSIIMLKWTKQFKSDLEAYGLLNNVTDEQFNEMYPGDTVTVYGRGY